MSVKISISFSSLISRKLLCILSRSYFYTDNDKDAFSMWCMF